MRNLILPATILTLAALATAAPPSPPPTTQPTPPSATQPTTNTTPTATLFGIESPAHRIVYILQHSGGMLDTFNKLRTETIRSVNALAPDQTFNVVMVSEKAAALYPKLQNATPNLQKDLAAKLNVYRAQGMSNDQLRPFQDAFEKALALQPDVIFFVTNGHFDPRLVPAVETLNKTKKVRINVLSMYAEKDYEDRLKQLAEKNGGIFKTAPEKDPPK